MPRAGAIDVFEYLDYRAFLRDFYLDRKAAGRGMSYRAFSRRAGLRSPNYLKLVIDGQRDLSDEMAARFATACGLEGEQAAYFRELVAFGQARTVAARNACYSHLTGFRRYRSLHKLELAQAAYHSTWYLPAIRELTARHDFVEDPAWIARVLVPPIGRDDAARGLATLLELGLVVRDARGRIRQHEPLVSTGPEAKGLYIANYHRTMLSRAAEAIDLVAASERDISSLTLCLGADGLRRLKERIQRFRRELLELSALEEDPEQVIQVNFQLFPLSKRRDEENGA